MRIQLFYILIFVSSFLQAQTTRINVSKLLQKSAVPGSLLTSDNANSAFWNDDVIWNGTNLEVGGDEVWHDGYGGDNLGNHTATENVRLSNNWLSNDGGNEGVHIGNNGNVGVNTISSAYALAIDATGRESSPLTILNWNANNTGLAAIQVSGTPSVSSFVSPININCTTAAKLQTVQRNGNGVSLFRLESSNNDVFFNFNKFSFM